jgi:hypothetical protein
MGFTCQNEAELAGGSAEERRKAAALLLAVDCVDEDTAYRKESELSLLVGFDSRDGLPEEELSSIAGQFPSLSLVLVYFSLDGEFYGYARSGGGKEEAESEDFAEGTREEIAARYEGDTLGFVRGRYSLELSSD